MHPLKRRNFGSIESAEEERVLGKFGRASGCFQWVKNTHKNKHGEENGHFLR